MRMHSAGIPSGLAVSAVLARHQSAGHPGRFGILCRIDDHFTLWSGTISIQLAGWIFTYYLTLAYSTTRYLQVDFRCTEYG